jgi:DNA-binding transcriptional ArsR family regulator
MQNAEATTQVMRALADPTRRAVLERIIEAGEITAGTLVQHADVSQPAVSQHLRALREAGLVFERRDGRHINYRANPHGLAPIIDWLAFYGSFWRERFTNLAKLLKELDP